MLLGLITAAISEIRQRPDALHKLAWMWYLLPLPVVQLLIAYGLFSVRRWARALALAFCVLYVFIFPLGTLLAVYTWWFLYSDNGRHLYGAPSPPE